MMDERSQAGTVYTQHDNDFRTVGGSFPSRRGMERWVRMDWWMMGWGGGAGGCEGRACLSGESERPF